MPNQARRDEKITLIRELQDLAIEFRFKLDRFMDFMGIEEKEACEKAERDEKNGP